MNGRAQRIMAYQRTECLRERHSGHVCTNSKPLDWVMCEECYEEVLRVKLFQLRFRKTALAGLTPEARFVDAIQWSRTRRIDRDRIGQYAYSKLAMMGELE